MSTDQPAILRPGAISAEQIEKVINKPVLDQRVKVADSQVPKAPGMKYKHYAPNAQVYVVDSPDDWKDAAEWAKKQDHNVGVMAVDDELKSIDWPDNVETYSLGNDVLTASHALFAGLRYFDNDSTVKSIFAQGFATNGIGEAYMNRLNKSAGQKHFKA